MRWKCPLQFSCWPAATGTSKRRVIDLCNGYDITDAQLHLQVAIAWTMVLGKEHKAVVGDNVGFIDVASEHHLTANGLLGSGYGHLFTLVIDDELGSFPARKTAGPQHEDDPSTSGSLAPRPLTKV